MYAMYPFTLVYWVIQAGFFHYFCAVYFQESFGWKWKSFEAYPYLQSWYSMWESRQF